MSDLEKRDVEGLQETHRLVVKALAAEREKVRVLRGVLEHVAATVDAAIYAENSDDDYNLKNAARKTAEAALAATEDKA